MQKNNNRFKKLKLKKKIKSKTPQNSKRTPKAQHRGRVGKKKKKK